jgi:hypothetical protein
MGTSKLVQVGEVLLNMDHIAAVIPIKNKSGEVVVEIIFAAPFQGSLVTKTLCNEEATAFVEALRARQKHIYTFDGGEASAVSEITESILSPLTIAT